MGPILPSSPHIPFTLSKQRAVYLLFIHHPYLLNDAVKLLLFELALLAVLPHVSLLL